MQTKLTLRLDDRVIRAGKRWAGRRGKSLSRVVSDYLDTLAEQEKEPLRLPPRTARLVGLLKGSRLDRGAHRKHLEEKHR
jgi:hypothetical protein